MIFKKIALAQFELGSGRLIIVDWSGFDAFDFGAEFVEFFVDGFVAAVDVVDAVYLGDAVGLESGEDEGGGGAEVAGHDGSAAEEWNAGDDGGGAL